MRNSLRMLSALVLLLTGSFAHAAFTVITVPSNTTNEIFGTKGDCPANTGDNIFDLQADSTLLCSKKSQSGFNLWASVICTNGAATLVVGEGVDQLDFKYNLIVRAPGSLTIKTLGCRKFFFGHDINGSSATDNCAQYDFSGLNDIVNADGDPLTPDYFTISRAGTLFGLPPSQVPFTVKAATRIAIPSAGVLTNDTIVLSPESGFQANLLLLNTNALSAGQTVKLATYRTIGLRPCLSVPDFASEQTLTWKMAEGGRYAFDVEGLDQEATLYSSCNKDVEFAGKVTGAVELKADLSNDDWAKMKYSCTGDLTEWTGRARLGTGEKLLLNATNVTHAILWEQSELSFADGQAKVNIDLAEGRQGESMKNQQCVKVAAGQAVSIQSVIGPLVLSGDPDAADDVIDVAVGGSTGAFLTDDGTATVTFNGQPEPADCLSLTTSTRKYWFLPDEEGMVTSPGNWVKPPASNSWYVVRGDVTVDTLPLGVGLRRAAGDEGKATIRAGRESASVVGVHAGESVVVETPVFDWRTKALLWLDPSQEDKFVWVREKDDDASAILTGTYSNETCNTFRGLIDPRSVDGLGLRAWQSRSWMNYATKGYESLEYVHPMRAKKFAPVEGLAYMSFGATNGSRRIQFENWTEGMTGPTSSTAGFTNVNAKFVVMVFGSQDGGGSAMFASSSYFKRTGKTLADPMVNKTIDIWTNGVKVADSKTALFSGGWDVISVNTSGASGGLSLLGGNGQSDAGGHYLGEMLFFDAVLSDADRRDVELYLAKKWGLASKYAADENTGLVTLSGSGAVSVEEGSVAQLSGAFSGTLTLGAGAKVTLAPGAAPYTEAEVGALGPTLWIDPSLGNEVITYGTTATTWANVNYIVQRDPNKRARDGTNFYLTGQDGDRRPTTTQKTCFFGPTYTWVDYNGTNETLNSQGNTLRTTKSTSHTGGTTTMDTQMGFIVQDSRRGGGTPFSDTVLATGLVKGRTKNDYTTSMYASGTTPKLTGSPVYLNGAKVDYTKGFTGTPEVFTFTATEAVPVGFFAYLGNSENGARNGEEQSEILLFGSKLDDGPRSQVEAYLMKKWFGYAPEGFTDYSSATLDGAGSFAAANAAVAPKLAPTFVGTYAVGGETATYDVTIRDDRTVDSELLVPGATLSLPATVVLNVSVLGRLRTGDYVLVQAASLGESAFALIGGLAGKSNVELIRTDSAVILRKSGGLGLIIR